MNDHSRDSICKFLFYGIGLFLVAFLFGRKSPTGTNSGVEQAIAEERKFRRLVFQGWLIVCGISLAFVAYGIFAFFTIGDKEPPGWDFGGVQDIPGATVYSTFPYRVSDAEINPQHVDERPPGARAHILGPPPTSGHLFEGAEHEGPGKGSWRLEYGPKNKRAKVNGNRETRTQSSR